MASKFSRPPHFNAAAKTWRFHTPPQDSLAVEFHKSLPDYTPTPLVSLPQVAQEVGVKAVHVKCEGQRLGLPSFKILGASWGIYKALVRKLDLPSNCDIPALTAALSATAEPPTLLAATDGNHGRAVARMGYNLGLPVRIFVPSGLDDSTVQAIKSEGAAVTSVAGSYDSAVEAAFSAASEVAGGLLIQDTAFPGYDEIPSWVIEGYTTMLRETDLQLGNETADLVVAPVGVGSFAQAVVSHYKAPNKNSETMVLTVEPDTASCLYSSLTKGERITIQTPVPTIMAGLDCGTVSSNAWPSLMHGVDISLTVSDFEAHEACRVLNSLGVAAGPCGAAPLAALRRLSSSDKARIGLNQDSVIVLFCTEGQREYAAPRSVAHDDAVSICQNLVQINSSIPGTGAVRGPGETEIARYIAAWLAHRDIETHWIEPTKGRPSVVGVVRGEGGGKSLMLNGHMDTVTVASYEGNAMSGHITDGKLYGRGAADMKCGLAAIMVALAQAKQDRLPGDVIFTGVADEEDVSIGTEQVLAAGWRADAAIVCEPTLEDLITAHKGFAWFEVDIYGLAAHGSRFDLGIDAICRAGYFLVELDKYAKRLVAGPGHPLLGTGSVHASTVSGGEEPASYPAKCTITIERRTVTGETREQLQAEMEALLDAAAKNAPGFTYNLRTTFSRNAFEIANDHPFVSLVADQINAARGKAARVRAEAFWTDCALISDVGMPVVMYGPYGEGLHAKEEWVDIKSIDIVASTLTGVMRAFCNERV